MTNKTELEAMMKRLFPAFECWGHGNAIYEDGSYQPCEHRNSKGIQCQDHELFVKGDFNIYCEDDSYTLTHSFKHGREVYKDIKSLENRIKDLQNTKR